MGTKIDQCVIDKDESEKAFKLLTSGAIHDLSVRELIDYKRKLIKHIPANQYEIYTKQNKNLISLIDTKIDVLKLEQSFYEKHIQPIVADVIKTGTIGVLGFVIGTYSSGIFGTSSVSQLPAQSEGQVQTIKPSQ